MDYLTLNALGITLLAAFGLWAFQRGAQGGKKRPPRSDDDDNKKDKS